MNRHNAAFLIIVATLLLPSCAAAQVVDVSPPPPLLGDGGDPKLTLSERFGGAEQAAKEPLLPDPKLTPCLADPKLTKEVLCKRGFSTNEDRNVEESTKEEVCEEYGLPKDCNSETAVNGKHEIDHCIALTVGGSNDISNLWPQSYVTKPWNAHIKDRLEVHLHSLMCKGTMTLREAQDALRSNWIDSYTKSFGQAR